MLKKIALTLAVILSATTLSVSAERNPYNEMDVFNLTNQTIGEVAAEAGMTLEEFKKLYGLPEDMPADTNERSAEGYTSVKILAEASGVSVEEAIELIKEDGDITIEITGDTLCKDIYDYSNQEMRDMMAYFGIVSYYDGDDILVMVKGKYLDFDVPPVVEDNRVFVPMRNIFAALGAEVYWQGDVQTVLAVRGDDVIAMQLGQNYLFKNNEKIEIPAASIARDGRTLVPVRAVAEALDTEVFYNGNTQTVVIH